MEGLNDEMSVQLMVATFNNYQELVDDGFSPLIGYPKWKVEM